MVYKYQRQNHAWHGLTRFFDQFAAVHLHIIQITDNLNLNLGLGFDMPIDPLKHRPRQARSEAKLDALMNAVEILLREKPYNDVSVAELAVEAGVSPAYLYTRFENKQAWT